MDIGKQTLESEKRQERAKSVKISFVNPQHFDVIDEMSKPKYLGIIIEQHPHQNDFCTCPSFYFGNSDDFKKTHPAAFQCKHLDAARTLRYGGYPE